MALDIPCLSIRGFRGISSLNLPQLGRVTLLAGHNGIGKTTVLEAVRLYASRGEPRVLVDLIDRREEVVPGLDEDGDAVLFPDFSGLFHSHGMDTVNSSPYIEVAASDGRHGLMLHLVDRGEDGEFAVGLSPEIPLKDLQISVGEHRRRLSAVAVRRFRGAWLRRHRRLAQQDPPWNGWPSALQIESLGPGLPDSADVGRLWDAATLTEAEDFAVRALRIVVGDRLQRLAVVGDSDRGRRVLAKLALQPTPVPLKRLGDGAGRMLAIALALANVRNGVLLIDEVENGIHYSVQSALWRLVFAAAESANVQVIAATHSWDAVVGFATAAVESPADGRLYRLDRFADELYAVPYSEEKLEVAARQRTEVR